MSSQDRYEDGYVMMPVSHVAQAEPKDVLYVRACRGPKDWRTDICDRPHQFKPINFDGRPRPMEKRVVQSKTAKRGLGE